MKRLIAALLVVALGLSVTACGHPLTVEGRTYPTYGLFNENTSKSKNVCYEVSVGNVVWSIIGIENVVMPVYFVGFSIMNPVREKSKTDKNDDCTYRP